jgi:hypothetical protein
MDLVREFLSRSFIAAGGAVEDSPGGLYVVLPQGAARRYGLAEDVEITLVADAAPGTQAVDGRLGSRLIDGMAAARLAGATLAAAALPAELPRSLPEGRPVLLNAVRIGGVEEVRTPARFLAAELRLTLQGDEQRNVLVSVTLRLGDGARVRPFNLGAAYPVTAAPLDERERRSVVDGLRSWLRHDGPRAIAGALDTLRRRASRDLERMADYYASLDVEMARAIERARTDDERARRLAKRRALAADLAARRGQLRERMRARLSAAIVAATLLETEVERFTLPVRRRNLAGEIAVCCRAADGLFEGPACAACGVATLRFYLCDERFHVLCAACGQAGRLDASRCAACTRRQPASPTISVEDPTARLQLG